MNIKIRAFFGKDIADWIDSMAKLRISEFKEFPYLYSGNMNIEKDYLSCYAKDEHGLFLIAFDGNKVIGVASGIPLAKSTETVPGALEIFNKNNVNTKDFYYFGEFIVCPQYRNKGIFSKLFFEECELVKKLGYKNACLMTVDREKDHPSKPLDYRNTDEIWAKFGFEKTNYRLTQQWPTIMPDGTVVNIQHSLSFWIKELNSNGE